MKKTIVSAACLVFLVWFCGPVSVCSPPEEWDPALIEGGFMFKEAEDFRQYLLRADSVAVGRLTAWDGKEGKVRVEKVFRGTPGKEPSFRHGGGLVFPKKGDKVLLVLARDKDRVVLHSFCAASGLFSHKGNLEKVVDKLLSAKKRKDKGEPPA